MACNHCGKGLNRSQYDGSRTWKSCPSCSTADATEHVFHPYPDAYGTTEKRSTPETPDGPQSHCTACRSKAEGAQPAAASRRCSDV